MKIWHYKVQLNPIEVFLISTLFFFEVLSAGICLEVFVNNIFFNLIVCDHAITMLDFFSLALR